LLIYPLTLAVATMTISYLLYMQYLGNRVLAWLASPPITSNNSLGWDSVTLWPRH